MRKNLKKKRIKLESIRVGSALRAAANEGTIYAVKRALLDILGRIAEHESMGHAFSVADFLSVEIDEKTGECAPLYDLIPSYEVIQHSAQKRASSRRRQSKKRKR